MADYDSPWKEALDLYFKLCLALLFPEIYAKIDWERGYEPLDKELQQIVADAEQGRRYVDKLFKVWAKDGGEMWVLLHIEVQTTQEPEFPRRMYVYNYRIDARYNQEVVSIAILADDDPNWWPSSYSWERWGCRKRLDFPCAKLLDFAGREAELEASDNPFARVILAHLKALETRGDDPSRRAWKLRLVRGLYERGFTRKDILELFRLIDWLMDLPRELASQFLDDVKQIEEENKMPFITTPERIGMERGMEKGMEIGMEKGRRETLLSAIANLLGARFGEEGTRLSQEMNAVVDEAKLWLILRTVGTGATLEETKQSLAK